MMPVAGTNRILGGAVLASALIALALAALAGPARAQVVPPNRNAVNFSVATFSGAPVWSLGFSYGVTEHLDLTASYSFQSATGASGGLFGAGVRYHIPVPTAVADVYVGAGIASLSPPFPGFAPATSSTSLSVGAGGSVRFTSALTGYAGGSVVSLGGTNAIIDLGLMLQLAPRVSGQLGYLNFAGAGAPYLGINLGLP
jgi:hypothetical protein